MKVILSRKGFDSVSGGMMSPIMPNGDLLSMPIPSGGDPYSYREVFCRGRSLREILLELNPRFNVGMGKLYRSSDEKVIAGVCAGLAHTLDFSIWLSPEIGDGRSRVSRVKLRG